MNLHCFEIAALRQEFRSRQGTLIAMSGAFIGGYALTGMMLFPPVALWMIAVSVNEKSIWDRTGTRWWRTRGDEAKSDAIRRLAAQQQQRQV
jgi:hypothetical protein